jgi:predicted TIM-barrel fold metal-dependent hydrolase
MPLREYMKIVSVDDHLFEHGHVWTDRLPKRYQEIGPHLIEDRKLEYWVYEDQAVVAFSGIAVASGRRREDLDVAGISIKEALPGAIDPVARLKDMDTDGVWAQMCFPSYPRFAGTKFLEGRDRDLALLCVKAYNDFVVEEWCAADPGRYIPLIIIPLWDPVAASVEIERMAAQGARSISFPENFEPLGLPSIHTSFWDPVFSVCQDADLPLSVHFGTSGRAPFKSSDAPLPVEIALMGTNSMSAVAEFVFSPVFHKFPELKVALSEGGIGWIPWFKERLDYVWERQGWTGINQEIRPSKLFEDHFVGCFIDEEVGIELHNRIGSNKIMLESDYPHSDSSWPHTRERVEILLAGVPDEAAHQICESNARGLYNFPGV